MKNEVNLSPMSRREFLRSSTGGLGLVAFSSFAPSFITNSVSAGAPRAERDRRILVIIQLAGGNDGLNTVIPHTDDHYFRLRPTIAIKDDSKRHKLNDDLSLHPSCTEMAELYNEGLLSIVQNVGYPNPNRSHFRSTEIWETASDSDENLFAGWMGRYFDNQCSGSPRTDDPRAVHIGNEVPGVFASEKVHSVFGAANFRARKSNEEKRLLEQLSESKIEGENPSYLRHTLLNTMVVEDRVAKIINSYKPMASYPGTRLGQSLKNIAAMIASNMETRVYYATLGGFDTHADQGTRHPRLLNQLSTSLKAFQSDLQEHKLDDRVLTMTFSEFGRRPSENASGGTDHGTAAPLFVMGAGIKSTLSGTQPNLNLQKNKDLTYSTDFRQVYATVLNNWLECDHEAVLDGKYNLLPFV